MNKQSIVTMIVMLIGSITAQGAGDSFLIEAEDYVSAVGVRFEDCTDEGGGTNLAYISDMDWCMYENIEMGTNALLNFRVARLGYDDGHIEVRLDATNGTLVAQVDVPVTGGWQEWETLSTAIGAVDGVRDIYLVFVETSTTNNHSMFNLNWWSREVGPVRIEAEDYTAGAGWRFEDTDDIGGGQNLGWIDAGEWMEYTINVETAGLHKIDFRVAADAGGEGIEIISNGATIGSISIADTGGWQVWTTGSTYVNFTTTGTQTLRLEFLSGGFNLNWFSYELAGDPTTLNVGSTRNQMMRYGIDYERLWYWYGSGLADVPQWSVNDCNVDYVRTAMNSGYELVEANFNLSAYSNKIIPMMTAMQNANPNIKWFASPRPLDEAVSGASWQPYPLWVTGATTYTAGDYDFNATKCAEYMIRYLLLMKSYGFKITYMDLTNEWQSTYASSGGRFGPDDAVTIKQVFDTYLVSPWPHPALDQSLLLEADDFPLMVGASSWSYYQGSSWISKFTTTERQNAIDIASSHNTDRTWTAQDFADAAKTALGSDVEVWETEQHGWKSTSGENEVTSFYYYMESIRAGFSGINGWLAIGTTSQGHCYLLNNGTTVTRNVKYYIFKKLSNTSNYGYALDIDQPAELNNTMALIRENVLTVWVNNTTADTVLTEVDIGSHAMGDATIRYTRWNESLSVEGVEGSKAADSSNSFTVPIEGESLYCFEVTLADGEDNFPFVQAESYDYGSGVSVQSCSDTDGGSMVAFGSVGSEISFDLDITKTYIHDVALRVSSDSANIAFDIYDGTTLLASVNRMATGGDQNWTTIYQTLPMDGGPMDLRIVATGGGWNMNWIAFDQQFYSTEVELENLALGLSASAYSASNVYGAGYEADKAFDGDRGTRWASSEAPAWLAVDFGTPTSINGVSFYDYKDRTTSYEIQYSNDGSTWYTAFADGNPADDVVINFPTVTAQHFRYQSVTSSGGPTIWELGFYHDAISGFSDPVTEMSMGNNSISLSWAGEQGATYALQGTTNLVTDAFMTIESGIPVHELTNSAALATPDASAFYRVILE